MKKFLIVVFSTSIIAMILVLIFVLSKNSHNVIRFEDENLEYVIRETLGDTSKAISKKNAVGITELDASNRGIKNLEGIDKLPSLTKLNLEGNEIKDISPLSKLVNLENLNLGSNSILSLEGVNFDKLNQLPNLKKLKLNSNIKLQDDEKEIKLSDISLLDKFLALEELDLSNNDIKDISPLKNLIKIDELDLSQNEILNGSIEPISSLTSLKKLNLRECGVRDISPIENFSSLVYLNIHSNPNIISINPIGKLTGLKTLIMRNVPIGDQISVIENLTNLHELNVRNTSISDLSILVKLIQKGALQDNSELDIVADVDIRDNPIPISEDDKDGYTQIRPYWEKITNKNPIVLPNKSKLMLFINEVMTSNDKAYAGMNGKYEDWVELYNPNDNIIDLTGYYLSDKEDAKTKWKFPENTIIASKGYLIVWASGEDDNVKNPELHVNFKISSDGEAVVLTEPDGETIVDYLIVPTIQSDVSYGRKPDGSNQMDYFDMNNITPGKTNNLSEAYLNNEIQSLSLEFSHIGGYYDDDVFLEMATNDKDAVVYYTLDGSEPDPKNINGAGDSYNVKYSYNKDANDNADDIVVNQKKNTFIYDGNPIEIKSREGEANVLSEISTSIYFKTPEQELSKASIVRARAYKGELLSDIQTHTFFIGDNIKENHNLPVMSIVTDSENLFGFENGIYVPGKMYDDNFDPNIEVWRRPANYKGEGEEWERPIHLELFEESGELGFSQNVGARIHGLTSRTNPHKSFYIHARDKYDADKSINYKLFPGLTKASSNEPIEQFKTFLLRNSGNDSSNTMFRDALGQSLVSHTTIGTQAYRPLIVYLNGEYWGIHNMRERYDEDYLENKYDVNPDEVVVLKSNAVLDEGQPGDEKHYKDMIDFVVANDLSVSSNYEYLKTQMDIINYTDYYLTNIYFGNNDWPQNNIKFWRLKTDSYNPASPYGHDGRWRWLLFDTDYAFGRFSEANFNSIEWAAGKINAATGEEWPNALIYSLLQNESYKIDFINRFADHLNTSFKNELVVKRILEMYKYLKPEMKEHTKHWGNFDWEKNVQSMVNYARLRPDYLREHIVDFFNLDGTANIQVTNDSKTGYVMINSIELNENTPGVTNLDKWSGVYFKSIPIKVLAVPQPGYSFVAWESNIEDIKDLKSENITIILDKDITLRAVFEIKTSKPAQELIDNLPLINELTFNHENIVKDARKMVEKTYEESKLKQSDIVNINKLIKAESKLLELKRIKEGKEKEFGTEEKFMFGGLIFFLMIIAFNAFRSLRYGYFNR